VRHKVSTHEDAERKQSICECGEVRVQAAAHVERAPVVDRVRLHGLAQIRFVLVQPVAFTRHSHVLDKDEFCGASEWGLREHERVAGMHFDDFNESRLEGGGHAEGKVAGGDLGKKNRKLRG
jgi:hypothetical protein